MVSPERASSGAAEAAMQVYIEGLVASGLDNTAIAGFKTAVGLVLMNPEGMMAVFVAWLNGHPVLGAAPENMERFRRVAQRQADELLAMWQDAAQMMGGLGRGQGEGGGSGGRGGNSGPGIIRP